MTGRLGLFRHTRWGRNLDLFLLDARSFRSADVTRRLPGLGGADQAPTMPDVNRGTSGIPSLANPVAAGCRDAIDSPTRHCLGEAQYAALVQGAEVVAARGSTCSSRRCRSASTTSTRTTAPRASRSERLRLLDALRDPANGLKNVVVLSGAAGGTLSSELRLQTLEAGRRDRHRHPRVRHRHQPERPARRAARPPPAWRLILHGALPTGVGVGCTALTTTSPTCA